MTVRPSCDGAGAEADTLVASAKAYLSVLNKPAAKRGRLQAQASA
jgi:hypothetical protein